MPLDTSSYTLAHLRLDGRRWNEHRHLSAQISTQAAADGSSYLEQGNTKLLCTVTGPSEPLRRQGSSSATAAIEVEISLAGFSGVDRKKQAGDRRLQEMQSVISAAFQETLSTHLYPHSSIVIRLYVLVQDGGVLAACINAATLALIDAGVPMTDYISACTAGSTASYSSTDQRADPLVDLSALEEQELPFLTVATVGDGRVSVLNVETRVDIGRMADMLAVGVEGCGRVRGLLDDTVRAHGKAMVAMRRNKGK